MNAPLIFKSTTLFCLLRITYNLVGKRHLPIMLLLLLLSMPLTSPLNSEALQILKATFHPAACVVVCCCAKNRRSWTPSLREESTGIRYVQHVLSQICTSSTWFNQGLQGCVCHRPSCTHSHNVINAPWQVMPANLRTDNSCVFVGTSRPGMQLQCNE